MAQMKTISVAVALAAVGIFGFFGIFQLSSIWDGPWRDSGEKPFRIGFNTWVGYGPLYIAQETGIFKSLSGNIMLDCIAF